MITFAVGLIQKTLQDELFAFSNELAYKILLAFFPFVLFLISLLGFLNMEDIAMQL